MHVAVFLQYYHTPDCPTAARPYALVERLARDHDVTVITTRSWEGNRLSHRFPWTPAGVNYVGLDVPYDNKMGSLRRLNAFFQYAVRAGVHALRMDAPDLIIGSSPPLTVAATAAAVASRRKIPWVFEVQDLWPAFPLQMGAVPPIPGLPSLLRGLERMLYRDAAHVVTVSPDMSQHVRTVAPSADPTTLQYGSDLQLADAISADQCASLRRRFSLDRRFLVLYAGTFGRANDIPTLLNAAERFANRSDVLFAFAGHGYHEPTVRRAARQFEHIRHLPPLPYPDALALFSLADLSLVSFLDRPVLAANSPSKLYDSLATGTPVVVTNFGWTKRVVETYNCGWYVPPEAPDVLAKHLRMLLDAPERLKAAGQNARAMARQQFDRSAILNRYINLIDRIERSL
jgi:glycosyltransferase involved in cell wall biosynthesis